VQALPARPCRVLCRVQDNAAHAVQEERALTPAALHAGVVRAAVRRRLGTAPHPRGLPPPCRVVQGTTGTTRQDGPPDVVLLVTTRRDLDAARSAGASRYRWAVELLFKEWKSYANLHAFDTANPALVEGLMWAAIAAAALTRFLAHMTQLLMEVPMSTRKVAMCARHVLGALVEALKRGDVIGLYTALEAAITYLACHAQRAHPARDRQRGRSQLGLEPCFEKDDAIEFAAAA
jgi:hypothetical protein